LAKRKKKQKNLKKSDMLRSTGNSPGRTRKVSLEEEKEGYGGKDSQKREVF